MIRCDVDSDGFIDLSEFVTAAMDWETALTNENLHAAFSELDVSKTGKISE